ncbi:MAG TPA: class I SAM-dependent methyltransferase [Terracidiphilus sp.]
MQTVRGDYDRVAERYAGNLFRELDRKPFDREVLQRFATATKGRGRVCDMGCGPGQIARFLHEAGADVLGLDLSPGMLAQARALNPDLEFCEGNMLALPFGDGELAGITAFYSIVNIPSELLDQVFREMERVLIPGGLLLLAFHIGGQIVRPEELWGRPVSMEFFFHEAAIIEQKLRAAGFTIEETLEREPYAPEVEHQSRRAYIFARSLDRRTA